MERQNADIATIKHPRGYASQLSEASERIYEIVGLFEFITRCADWETEQPLTPEGRKRYLELVEYRAEATDNLLKLASGVLLGPVLDTIHGTEKALEEAASRP